MSVFDAMFNTAAAPALAGVHGTEVTIRRGDLQTPGVPAIPRRREYEVGFDQQTGLMQVVAFRDYLIDVALYAFRARAAEPLHGDRIVETIGGEELTFEVLPAGNRPAVEPEDASGVRWLIHTKQVA